MAVCGRVAGSARGAAPNDEGMHPDFIMIEFIHEFINTTLRNIFDLGSSSTSIRRAPRNRKKLLVLRKSKQRNQS
jgi:hypothetical protein